MATLFWVGGSTAYDGVTNRLATTSGGTATVAAITSADTVTFDANSPAAAAVTTSANISCTSLTFASGFTGSLTMSNTLTVSGAITHTQGTLNTNGQTCSWGSLTSTSGSTRALTLGASAITMTGTNSAVWNLTTSGMTLSAASATITCTGTNSSWSGQGTYGTVKMNGSGTTNFSSSGSSFTNFERNGTATNTDSFLIQFNFTVTGTLTIASNAQNRRMIVGSSTVGTPVTVTAAAVSLSNFDIRDITAAGAAAPWTGTSIGNAFGNTNITFTSPRTLYRVGAGGNYTASNWSLSSGGATGENNPLPQDTVMIDSGASGTITMDAVRLGGNIDFTGFTGTASFGTITNTLYGSLTLGGGMTISGTQALTLAGRSSFTVTSNGKTLTQAVTFNALGGTYTLQDAFATASSFNLTAGSLITNGVSISTTSFASSGSLSRSVNWGASNVTLTGTAPINISGFGASQGTWTAGTSVFNITDTSASTKSIIPGGANIHFNDVVITGGGAGALSFNTGVGQTWNIDGTLTINAPKTLTFHAGFTYTVGRLVATGSLGNLITLQSDTAGSAFTIARKSGSTSLSSCDWLSIKDSTATPANTFYAGANSTDVSGNTGWVFSTPPTGGLLLMGIGS